MPKTPQEQIESGRQMYRALYVGPDTPFSPPRDFKEAKALVGFITKNEPPLTLEGINRVLFYISESLPTYKKREQTELLQEVFNGIRDRGLLTYAQGSQKIIPLRDMIERVELLTRRGLDGLEREVQAVMERAREVVHRITTDKDAENPNGFIAEMEMSQFQELRKARDLGPAFSYVTALTNQMIKEAVYQRYSDPRVCPGAPPIFSEEEMKKTEGLEVGLGQMIVRVGARDHGRRFIDVHGPDMGLQPLPPYLGLPSAEYSSPQLYPSFPGLPPPAQMFAPPLGIPGPGGPSALPPSFPGLPPPAQMLAPPQVIPTAPQPPRQLSPIPKVEHLVNLPIPSSPVVIYGERQPKESVNYDALVEQYSQIITEYMYARGVDANPMELQALLARRGEKFLNPDGSTVYMYGGKDTERSLPVRAINDALLKARIATERELKEFTADNPGSAGIGVASRLIAKKGVDLAVTQGIVRRLELELDSTKLLTWQAEGTLEAKLLECKDSLRSRGINIEDARFDELAYGAILEKSRSLRTLVQDHVAGLRKIGTNAEDISGADLEVARNWKEMPSIDTLRARAARERRSMLSLIASNVTGREASQGREMR